MADGRACRTVGGQCVVGLGGRLEPPAEGCAAPVSVEAALLRSPHSLQVLEEDLPELLSTGQQVPRCLLPASPARPYRRRQTELKTVVHWGQRKVLLSEVEFLSRHSAGCTRVVYAGAAPGTHVPLLLALFPHLSFTLVDPGEFRLSANGGDGRLTVRRELFSAALATELAGGKDEGGTLFISDIRTADSKVQDAASVDAAVARDMAMQMEWVRVMRPRMAMLKFRMPYAPGETEYFDGQLYLPVWGPATTTEVRLVTDGTSKRLYDHRRHEEQMFYFNTVTRVRLFRTALVGEGLCESYDSAAEMDILERYLSSLGGVGHAELPQSVSLAAGQRNLSGVPEMLRPLASLFHAVGPACSARGRHLLSALPDDFRQRWFSARDFGKDGLSYAAAGTEPKLASEPEAEGGSVAETGALKVA